MPVKLNSLGEKKKKNRQKKKERQKGYIPPAYAVGIKPNLIIWLRFSQNSLVSMQIESHGKNELKTSIGKKVYAACWKHRNSSVASDLQNLAISSYIGLPLLHNALSGLFVYRIADRFYHVFKFKFD